MQARHHVFGSDELSRHSPGPAELVGRACIYLHPEDAAALSLVAGDGAEIDGAALEVRIDASQAPGSAGYSERGSGWLDVSPLPLSGTLNVTETTTYTVHFNTLNGPGPVDDG